MLQLRDMEARMLQMRAEAAELVEEKQALQARLQKLHSVSHQGERRAAVVQQRLAPPDEKVAPHTSWPCTGCPRHVCRT